MAKREKGSCRRVHAWACAASASRSLKLLSRKIAFKFNFRRLKSYRAIVMLNTAPPGLPPPPRREGYPLMWTILGCAAGQDTVFGLCPYKTWYTILCASSPTGYGQYDRHSISLFCPKHGQGVKPSESPLPPNIY